MQPRTRFFLVLEDDSISQAILSRILTTLYKDSTVKSVDSSGAARVVVTDLKSGLDAVFFDEHILGGARGSEVAEWVRELVPEHTPVLVSVSGFELGNDVENIFDIVWHKPFPKNSEIKLQLDEHLSIRDKGTPRD